jgi:hypothetical protein
MNSHYQNAETQYIFATQGRFESNYSSCTGRNSENMKIYVTVEALGKMKGRMKLSLGPVFPDWVGDFMITPQISLPN